MKYKALFIDVDGTTVVHGENNLPSLRVTDAVAAAMRSGVLVSIATSRPLRTALPIIEHLGLNGICVLSSGAELYDPKLRQIIQKKKFPLAVLGKIAGVATMHTAELFIYDGKTNLLYDGTNAPQEALGVFFPKLTPQVLQEITKELSGVIGISLHRMEAWESGFECLDIVNTEATKFHGVQEVYTREGIPQAAVIGVGDGYNDFSLLLACGLKVAMGNAVLELKEVADAVTSSVENDGVADVIEKYILS